MDEHLGYEKNSVAGNNSGNSRNGYGKKTIISDYGECEIAVPRDRNGDFELKVIEKRQTIDSRRLELVGACFDPKSVLATVGVRGAVDYTVVQGRITVEQGHLVTVDEESLAREAEEKCRAYLNR